MEPMIRVSSFDVFDTCLTRTFAHPADLFLALGEIAARNGWATLGPKKFAEQRRKAEADARKLVLSREISLDQIYRQLGANLDCGGRNEGHRGAELSLEGESLRPIGGPVCGSRKRATGPPDPVPVRHVPARLLSGGTAQEARFLSGRGLSLHLGRRRAPQIGRRPFSARPGPTEKGSRGMGHLGDNVHADVHAPRRMGLDAEYFTPGLLNRYELRICPGVRQRHRMKARLIEATRLDVAARAIGVPYRGIYRERWQSRLVAAMRLRVWPDRMTWARESKSSGTRAPTWPGRYFTAT